MDDRHMLRHFLATLAYRFQVAIRGAPEDFPDLEPGWGIRTPLDLVHHIDDVLRLALRTIAPEGASGRGRREMGDWPGEVAAVHATLQALDDALTAEGPIGTERLERALHGPLADALTHVGQLVMLRRVAGGPIAGANYFRADVRTGRVGPHQPLSEQPTAPSTSGRARGRG